jgi:hypothetical protein
VRIEAQAAALHASDDEVTCCHRAGAMATSLVARFLRSDPPPTIELVITLPPPMLAAARGHRGRRAAWRSRQTGCPSASPQVDAQRGGKAAMLAKKPTAWPADGA